MTQGRTGERATPKGTAKQQFSMKRIIVDRRAWPGDELIVHCGFASSLTEARRLLQQGAVSFDGRKIEDWENATVSRSRTGSMLRVGKRRMAVLIYEERK